MASEIIARAFEDERSCHAELSDDVVVSDFLQLDEQLGLMRMLRALDSNEQDISENRNIILIFRDGVAPEKGPNLETRAFRDATDALQALFRLEEEEPTADIVLVRASSSEDVKTAFRNYFSDAREFIRLIDEGCQRLAGGRVISMEATP